MDRCKDISGNISGPIQMGFVVQQVPTRQLIKLMDAQGVELGRSEQQCNTKGPCALWHMDIII